MTGKLIDAVKRFEGLRLAAYKDAAGVVTIGYGHTGGVKAGTIISMSKANELLLQDLQSAEKQVKALDVCKSDGQQDALTDFVFNLGIGSLKRSALLKKIKAGADVKDIQAEFMRWNKAGGKVLKGLTNRRQWEANRFAE